MAFAEKTLSNGLRVVVETMPGATSAAGGFLVRTGSRDETPEVAGVSHFVEHMCFKGTHRRSWQEITVGFDELGSTYNAFTSKERTFYFGWVRRNDLAAQLDLLADMMRSAIPEDEFNTEKNVILEEIAMSKDQLERHVYEQIHECAFAGHPLAWPVLGDEKTVGGLSRAAMWTYFSQRYNPANIILVVAGNVEPDAVYAVAEKLCADWPAGSPRPKRHAPPVCKPGVAVLQMDRFKQQAIALTYPGPSATDEGAHEAASCLASVLGGVNSRFYWNIVQAGVSPVAGAWRVDYCDVGLMVLFGFCEPERVEALTDALRREATKVSREGVTDEELNRVKNRARTAVAVEAESPYHRLSQLADDLDTYDRPRTVEERLALLDAVSPREIASCIERWPITGEASLVSVGPRKWPE